MYTNSNIFLAGFVLLLLAAGCSWFDPLPAKERYATSSEYQRCVSNKDCQAGERCDRGFCEDIYRPRSKATSGRIMQ